MIQTTNKVVFLEHHRHKKHKEALQRKRLLKLLEDIERMDLPEPKREVVLYGLETIRKD